MTGSACTLCRAPWARRDERAFVHPPLTKQADSEPAIRVHNLSKC